MTGLHGGIYNQTSSPHKCLNTIKRMRRNTRVIRLVGPIAVMLSYVDNSPCVCNIIETFTRVCVHLCACVCVCICMPECC